jgi:hypothetical protein
VSIVKAIGVINTKTLAGAERVSGVVFVDADGSLEGYPWGAPQHRGIGSEWSDTDRMAGVGDRVGAAVAALGDRARLLRASSPLAVIAVGTSRSVVAAKNAVVLARCVREVLRDKANDAAVRCELCLSGWPKVIVFARTASAAADAIDAVVKEAPTAADAEMPLVSVETGGGCCG